MRGVLAQISWVSLLSLAWTAIRSGVNPNTRVAGSIIETIATSYPMETMLLRSSYTGIPVEIRNDIARLSIIWAVFTKLMWLSASLVILWPLRLVIGQYLALMIPSLSGFANDFSHLFSYLHVHLANIWALASPLVLDFSSWLFPSPKQVLEVTQEVASSSKTWTILGFYLSLPPEAKAVLWKTLFSIPGIEIIVDYASWPFIWSWTFLSVNPITGTFIEGLSSLWNKSWAYPHTLWNSIYEHCSLSTIRKVWSWFRGGPTA